MKKVLCILLLLVLLGLLGAMVFGVLLPYVAAGGVRSIPGELTMEQQADGQWLVFWQDARADVYRVEVWDADAERLLYRDFSWDQAYHILPALPGDRNLRIEVTPGNESDTAVGETIRYSVRTLKATARFTQDTLTVSTAEFDGDEKTLTLEVQCAQGSNWEYRLLDAYGKVLDQQAQSQSSCVLHFGGGDLAVPQEDAPYTLLLRCRRDEPSLRIYSPTIASFSVTAQSLHERELEPVLTVTSKNTIRITWGQTRAQRYEVQSQDDFGQWQTLAAVTQDGPFSYSTCLEPGQTYTYRLVAQDGQGRMLEQSDPMTARGQSRALYATIWPMVNLTAWDSPGGGQAVGTARAGTAYCVVEEAGGMFGIRLNDRICYIENSYCMINLPEYLGGLCAYNITNSYSSIFAIHGFAVENVTGRVTSGYETVQQYDGGFLVPLLYPTARKLLTAAQNALEQGYRLKIYDAYRPYVATRQAYDLTSLVLNDPVPAQTYNGVWASELGIEGIESMTLGRLMTGSNYSLNGFLAQTGSTHNQGVALDLTLEDAQTGVELVMQSEMHDLSQYSVLSKNNDTADLLGSIMHGAGFGGLVTEWWHFQDDANRATLTPPYMSQGVDAQCWVKDDLGWRYRNTLGEFFTDTTITVDGNEYSLDSDGYLIG